MSHFLCISITKINHLDTRPPYLGAISNKFLSIVKIEIMRLLSKHVSRNHICGQHMEVMHLNINMWIQQLEGGDAQNIMFLIIFLQVDESCETTYTMNKDDMICVADDMCITLKSMDDLIDDIYEKLEQ
jgi:hypothetical protein